MMRSSPPDVHRAGRAWPLSGLGNELRAAARRLLRSPGFAGIAVLTFALGVAGTTALFGVLDQVYFRPLPFPEAGRLVRLRVELSTAGQGSYLANVLPAEVEFIAARSRTLDLVVAQRAEQFTLLGDSSLGGGPPLALRGASVSPRSLELFGWRPTLGRVFTAEEERQGDASGAVLISERLWHQRWGGDPAVLGRSVRLGERFSTVVGVLPLSFPYRADVWLPMRLDSADRRDLLVIGRLAPGAALATAQAELTALAAEYGRSQPGTALPAGLDAVALSDNLVRDEQRVALGLFAAAVLFLALAAINLAGLLAVRAVARQRDLAVRSALGATRLRQVFGLLLEPALVASAGGALALLAVRVGSPWLGVLLPQVLTEELGYLPPGLDGRIVVFALAASAVAALGAGLIPAAAFSRVWPGQTLAGGRSAGRASGERGTRVLLVAQVALVFAILLGAGSMIESFVRVLGRGVGFDTDRLLALEMQPPAARYADGRQRLQLVERLEMELAALPGTKAAMTTVNPLGGTTWGIGVGRSGTPSGALQTVNLRLVSPAFLGVMGVPVLRGRDVDATDRADAAPVAVVSRRLAMRLWGRENAVGETLVRGTRAGQQVTAAVVGVAGDVEDADDLRETLYLPLAQNADHPSAAESIWLMARGESASAPWVHAVESAVWRVDPELAWDEVRTMTGMRAQGLGQQRLGSALAAAFVGGALLLSALGLGGAVAFAVRQRQAEIGVRMALGSAPQSVVRLFAGRGLSTVLLGAGLGGAAYLGLRPLAAHFVSGVEVPGGWTLLAALALVSAVGALASYLPARRAARVDPVRALRED